MYQPETKPKTIHYTRWKFYPRLPAYVPNTNPHIMVVSAFERSGPQFTLHLFIHLN